MKQLSEIVQESIGQFFCIKVEKGEIEFAQSKFVSPPRDSRIDHFYFGKLDPVNQNHFIYPGQALIDLRRHREFVANYVHAKNYRDEYIDFTQSNSRLVLPYREIDMDCWGAKASIEGGVALTKYIIGTGEVVEVLNELGLYRKKAEPSDLKDIFSEMIKAGVRDQRTRRKEQSHLAWLDRSDFLPEVRAKIDEENAKDTYPS